MTFKINKDPAKMSLEELYKTHGNNPEILRGYTDGLEAAKKREEARNK